MPKVKAALVATGAAALVVAGVSMAHAAPKKKDSISWVSASLVNNGGCSFLLTAQLLHTVRAWAQGTLDTDTSQNVSVVFNGNGTDTLTWTFTEPSGAAGTLHRHAQGQNLSVQPSDLSVPVGTR